MFNLLRSLDRICGVVFSVVVKIFPGGKQKLGVETRKILCVKLWGLGNLIVIAPLMAKLKARYPHAKITFLTFDVNSGFLERNRHIDRVVYFQLTTDLFKILGRFFSLVNDLRRERFDVGINFEIHNAVSIFLMRLLRIPYCVGFCWGRGRTFYAHSVQFDASVHISLMVTRLLEPFGINGAYTYEPLSPRSEEVQRVAGVLHARKTGTFVCLHPGTSSNFRGKQYARGRWVILAQELIARHGVDVVLTGTSADREILEWIRKAIGRDDKVLNTAGDFNIGELAVLMQRCRVCISNDTGPAHLAASLGVNLAVFFGPASPDRYGPLNENSLIFYKRDRCSPCVGVRHLNEKCRHAYRCLDFDPCEVAGKISARFF